MKGRAAWFRTWAAVCALCFLGGQAAHAGGPRFFSGQGWAVYPGTPVGWNTTVLEYFTDPGDLAPGVSHAQADEMVAAAAAVWNVPTSSISYAQGGVLAEHVSTANTYFSGTQLVSPADVQPSNEANIPVAIVYDSDGGLIDLLLGEGASEPDGCMQNAVVGDVDDIHPNDAQIHHATLLLNGRCVGGAPEQLTQMQYQLARAFGRVLGLGWSQTDDNVFTGQTTVTLNQMKFWPLMHPIDLICGNYSYQCMLDPFTLRDDDLDALAQLYLVREGQVPQGKQATSDDALWLIGTTNFPNGQGMEWENVTTRRQNNGLDESWQTTSSVTGGLFTQALATPVNAVSASTSGRTDQNLDGLYTFRRVPLNGLSNVFFTTEPINPLYTGEYALGPYVRPPVTPSGSSTTVVAWSAVPAGDRQAVLSMEAPDAVPSCDPGPDGTEGAPASPDGSGWQQGQLCGWGHSSWWTMPVAAGHSWTLEVTATDETGAASVGKAMPVVGMWNASDPTGTLPTVASQAAPFNSMSLGMTQMSMPAPAADSALRMSVSDQFGAGRPDFTYTARFLYAASSTPATVGSGGGQIAITGTGFAQGNQVLVNGVAARVVSWSATQIVADAPPMALAGVPVGTPVTITVADLSTGGTATIPSALSYSSEPNVMVTVSAPVNAETGVPAAVPFRVRVLASDGLSPVANEAVSFSVQAGSASMGLCNGAATSCTGVTDADGYVETTVTGGAVGSITLQATDLGGIATVQVTIVDTDPVRTVSLASPIHYVAAGAASSWQLGLSALQDGLPAVGVRVAWSAADGLTLGQTDVPNGLVLSQPYALTSTVGVAQTTVTTSGLAAGETSTVTGCAWAGVCAVWSATGVDPSQWAIAPAAGAAQSVTQGTAFVPVVMTVTDLAGHLVEGAPVQVYQRVLAWEGVCATAGRCAAAPVLASSQVTLTTDGNGAISVAPLSVDGVPQVLQVAASTGTSGFVTLTLVKAP